MDSTVLLSNMYQVETLMQPTFLDILGLAWKVGNSSRPQDAQLRPAERGRSFGHGIFLQLEELFGEKCGDGYRMAGMANYR